MKQNNPHSLSAGQTGIRMLLGIVWAFSMLLVAGNAQAGDLTALNWDEGAKVPALEVWVSGSPAYSITSLDDGQRLRLSLSDTNLREVSDLDGRGVVKGVYPYLSETGTGVNIDFLMSEPGQLKLEPASYGYRVVAVAGGAAAKTQAAAPAPAPVPAAAPVVAPAPVVAAPAAPAAPANSIEQVVYAKLPGDRIQIQMRMSGTPGKPAVFTTNNPARIAFDFPNTKSKLEKGTVKIGEGAVTSVNVIEAKNRTRVVVNMVRPAGYKTVSNGNSFTVTVDNPSGLVSAEPQAAKTTRFATAARPGKHGIKNLDFRRGTQSDAKIIIGLSDTGVGINIREQAGEIIVDFLDTGIPADLQRRLDVTDFGTPVTNIDTFVQGKNVRMVIAAKGRYEHLAYQAGEVFTVNVKPISKAKDEEKKKDEFGYSGEKLSLNFQNIDVRAALQVIADFTGLNFVTDDQVKGNLTLRLKDVPWDQALDIIADAKNLAIRKNGNVVRVGPADLVAAKEKAQLEAGKAVLELEPLVSELIQINYAKAAELAKLLKSIKAVSPGGQAPAFGSVQKIETEANSLLSPRGQVTVDERTNTLLIQDTSSKVKEVRKLISQLDQPVRQVMIETRLVEATDDWAKNLGVRWAAVKRPNPRAGNNATAVVCGTIECTVDALNGDPINLNTDALSVNMQAEPIRGTTAGSLAVSVAKMLDGNVLTLELSALESEGKGKIISSPRLITSNQKKARIEQGQEGLFRALSAGLGTTSFVVRKAVLALEVTPQITPDDRIIMDVLITKDVFVDSVNGLIDKKEITTQVLLDNGETVVIGGIYEQQQAERVNKIPFFGDLPLLGWLFREKQHLDNKRELLIFLTPRIMSEHLSLK